MSYFDPRDEPMLRLRWPKAGSSPQLFLTDFSEGRCSIENPARKLRVARHLDDGVARVLDFRIGNLLAPDVALAVPRQCFHENAPTLKAAPYGFNDQCWPRFIVRTRATSEHLAA